ncbi:MAG: hypothetical protein KC731_08660 [Myxococcales bacterium]|nr:hypothetical protein [Myxococcales bacterium]
MRLGHHRPHAELVFHVLAHVAATAALPASVYDPRYVAFVAEALGPAEDRWLGEDARALGVMLRDHDALARVQLLAWLHDEVPVATIAAAPLTSLAEGEVARPELLAPLIAEGPAVELLRCSVALEAEAQARLPVPVMDDLGPALERVEAAAPSLARLTLVPLRALRLRGRVLGRSVLVGWPCAALDLSVEHVAWQAAHEATVREVASSAVGIVERGVERVALALLATRAAEVGLADEHRRWLAHLAGPPSVDPSALVGDEARRYAELCDSTG